MKLEKLYDEYVNLWQDNKETFTQSGMMHVDKKLNFGFFPFGTGILNQEIKRADAEIEKCSIMVLGNDFGTVDYLENKCVKLSEPRKSTIKNLIETLDMSEQYASKFFCTNLYMGVRIGGSNESRDVTIRKQYKDICYNFFLKQLELLQPKLIICLGNDVRFALLENSIRVDNWDPPGDGIIKICSDKEKYRLLHKKVDVEKIGQFDFMLIPHPSHGPNITPTIKENVTAILKADV